MTTIDALDEATGSITSEFYTGAKVVLDECGEPCEFEDSDSPPKTNDVELMLCHDCEEDSSSCTFRDTTSPSAFPVLNGGQSVVKERADITSPVFGHIDNTEATAVSSDDPLVLLADHTTLSESPTDCVDISDPAVESVVEPQDTSSGDVDVGGSAEGGEPAATAQASTVTNVTDAVTLISDMEQIGTLVVKDLKAQCKLRKLLQTGDKQDLTAKLSAYICANLTFTLPTTILFRLRHEWGLVAQSTRPTSSGTTVPPSSAAVPPVTPQWVELTLEQAKTSAFAAPSGPDLRTVDLLPSWGILQSSQSHPIEYFDMFISPEIRHVVLKNNTNLNAAVKGAGGEHYPNF
ncbi:hypothetical protein CYMTET_11983 [Cymbomonas tetramitiformis]|uniref:SAP domain-containing protein n=1 Tax=Cymbomonas tetramitiformis TaxID=36881 RepID=A0AAE0GLA2_9CHLO|nr:hypothetical protein CYMTET_11983 [Cymbomonas tetramitiformis]